MKVLLNLPKGAVLTCIHESRDLEKGVNYQFAGYDDSLVPVNNYKATMSWYPDRAIWTADEYEEIKFKFMRIKLVDVDEPQFLKDFEIYLFTD